MSNSRMPFPLFHNSRLLATAILVATCGCSAPDSAADDSGSALASVTYGSEVQASWLGTAGLYLSDGESALAVDPFLSRKPFFTVAFGRTLESDPALVQHWIEKLHMPKGLPVLVSHSHFDHILDAPALVSSLVGRLVGSNSTHVIGKASGLPERQLEKLAAGGTTQAGAFRIRALASCHSATVFGFQFYPGEVEADVHLPNSASAYRMGDTYSYVIEHPRGTILHHASACTLPGMFKGIKADVIFLGIASRTDTQQILRDVVDAVGAKRVIPIHYDNFFEPLEGPQSPLPGSDVGEFLETARKERPLVRFESWPVGQPAVVLPLEGKASN